MKPRDVSELHPALPDFTWIIYTLVYVRPLAAPETLLSFIIIMHVGCPFGSLSNMQVCEAALFSITSSSPLPTRHLTLWLHV